MEQSSNIEQIAQKVLLHLYNSTVRGSIDSIGMIIGMAKVGSARNPRFKDLRAIYDSLGADGRKTFYAAVVAIAEFAVYRTLDFVENYYQFDSEDNKEKLPNLSLVYNDRAGDGVTTTTLSDFGSVATVGRWRAVQVD